ncbi:MAG TPA: sulfotransferase [Rhodanobacteraceae bacterium]|nr:sulfotransferase [Rhodanobacteraceae bacterium]
MQPDSRDQDNARFRLASALWQRGEIAGAESLLRSLTADAPRREDAAMLLAEVLRNQGKLDAAAHAVFELCRAREFDSSTSLRVGRFIQECHRQFVADELCRVALARDGTDPELWALAGHVAREIGDFARARDCYEAALAAGIDLDRHAVFGALARTRRYEDAADPDFARFESHFRNASVPVRARAATGFGLAKAHDDIGDFRAAAGILAEANAMVKAAQPWQAGAWSVFVGSRRTDKVAIPGNDAGADFVPVFIVGLPRSGTTLTATRLAGCTTARDRGELRALRFIADTLIAGKHLGSASALSEAARLYRAHSVQDDAPARWYIDQDPLNFRYLDIAAAMFPQARIIHCRRSRRDTALSLWAQDFAHPDAGFAYDFSDIAGYAEGHDALMAHWRETLPVPIHELDYEALVADTDTTLRELAAFIGAPFAPQAQAGVPINSSSVWQARQPIYSTSVGRWRAYLPWIPELARFPE